MMLSANLGFLFTDRPLPEAVAAAKSAGFSAIECHYPYDVPPQELRAALDSTGLPLLTLNTWLGDKEAGDYGLAALPNRTEEARAEIDRAIQYAHVVGARAVHAMAGRSDGGTAAQACYCDNLAYATTQAARHGMNVLIEPINHRDVPGYHLTTVEQAADIVDSLGAPNLKIMFDCYHVQIAQGDVSTRFERHIANIGHVQIAAVPDRGEPDAGELNYAYLLPALRAAGYRGAIGAEYRPRGDNTESGLSWMQAAWARPQDV